jgi:hypothetical protein
MIAFARSHDLALYLTALQCGEIARREAALEAERAQFELAGRSPWWHIRHRVHALLHRKMHARSGSARNGKA